MRESAIRGICSVPTDTRYIYMDVSMYSPINTGEGRQLPAQAARGRRKYEYEYLYSITSPRQDIDAL